MEEDIKILEEWQNWNKEHNISTKTTLAIESLLKAYKQDEEVIDLMASYIWKYDCCEYEIGKDLKCKGNYLEVDCKENCIKEYFRKKVETNE